MKTSHVTILFLLAAAHPLYAQAAKPAPILLELFTSEGCSSCPPVDAWVAKLDASQPVPGAQIIVLSEHVNYWNQGGWTDPNSSSLLTDRQSAYSRALGTKDVYTPQLIVDGAAELHLNNPQLTSQIFSAAVVSPRIPMRITSLSASNDSTPALHVQIEAEANSQAPKADVFVAIALNHAESDVLHGENGGRRLTHVAVVESLKKIGKLTAGQPFSRSVELKLKPGTDPSSVRVVAFIQEPGPGKVLGAAMQRFPTPVTTARTTPSDALPR